MLGQKRQVLVLEHHDFKAKSVAIDASDKQHGQASAYRQFL